jgi:hypothetical protein
MSKPLYNTSADIPNGKFENVMVYRNLTRNCWSIKDMATNRVIGHAVSLELIGVQFKVSVSGRERVIRERKKYVHAGGFGTCEKFDFDASTCNWKKVKYNPYVNATFVDEFGNAIHSADFAIFDANGKVYCADAS